MPAFARRSAPGASRSSTRTRPRPSAHACARPERRRHHADRVGQDALLQRPGPATRSWPNPSTRALYLFPTKALAQDQLAELDRLVAGAQRGGRPRPRRLHLRRRHAAGRAQGDPRARAGDPDQPRHAALGHPAAPPAVGAALREPALHRHRRAARLPRRVRQPPGERAAPAAAHLPPLRLGPAVHLLVGDDREPARAGRAADRAAVRGGRRERRAARREVLLLRQPADRQPAARHPPVLHPGDPARRARVPAARSADHRLRAEPPGHRDPDALPEGIDPGAARGGRRGARLPGRLPAEPAPGDREGAARRRGAGGGGDQRARAGDRHRRPGRRGAGGLPGDDRRHVAAGGPRRPPRGDVGRGAGGEQRAARPVRRCATRRTSSTPRPSTR